MWRTMLMLAGLLVHGSVWLDDHPLFLFIDLVSKSFRMGVFFAISGFLAARAMVRHGTTRWLRTRLIQLGIPALFGIAILSPLVSLAAILRADPRVPTLLPFEWHHLWFLYGLLLYSGVIAVGARSLDVQRVCTKATAYLIAAPDSARVALLFVTLASALLLVSVTATIQLALPVSYAIAFSQVKLIAAYLPMFLLGAITATSTTIRDRVLAVKGAWAVLSLLVLICFATTVAQRYLPRPFAEQIEVQVRMIGATLGPPFAFVVVMRSALLITRVGPLTRSLSDASYTIYLLHFPALVFSNVLLLRSTLPPLAIYAISVTGVGIACYLFHVHVVRRVAILALLLNGRLAVARMPAGVAVST